MKKITTLLSLVLLLACFAHSAQAQGWWKSYAKKNYEAVMKVKKVSTGYVALGEFSGPDFGYFLMGVDSVGNELWYKSYSRSLPHLAITYDMLSNGQFVVMGSTLDMSTGISTYFVAKYDATGNELWMKYYTLRYNMGSYRDMIVLPNDTILLIGNDKVSAGTESELVFYKLDSNGDSLSYLQKYIPKWSTYQSRAVLGPNNQLLLSAGHREYDNMVLYGSMDFNMNLTALDSFVDPDVNASYSSKLSVKQLSDGYLIPGLKNSTGLFYIKVNLQWEYQWVRYYGYNNGASSNVFETDGGNLISGNSIDFDGYNTSDNDLIATVNLYSSNGVITESKYYPSRSLMGISQIYTGLDLGNGKYLFAGKTGPSSSFTDLLIFVADSAGNIYNSSVQGNVYMDKNASCTQDSAEINLRLWMVSAMGNDTFYTIADANGNYSLSCPPDNYSVRAIIPNNYWTDTICSDSLSASIVSLLDTAFIDIPVGIVAECPVMAVQVSGTFLRRCIAGPAYTISYCNNGTELATNAYVELTLQDSLVLDSASVAYTDLGNNVYRFDLGDVAINECGSMYCYIRADCNAQVNFETYCIEAAIFPSTTCVPPSNQWDGARLELMENCNADSLKFSIANTGDDMSVQKTIVIVQDDIMYVSGNIQLDALETLTWSVPANGATWTFITEQTPFFPGNHRLIQSVEGCGTNNQGQISTGYLLQFPQIGPDYSTDGLCMVAVGSLDPNDKEVEPKGLGMEGFIEEDQTLHYTIHFQNTGTDTAFTVRVEDLLSPYLNVGTIRNVTASHPFEWKIENGRNLVFKFDKIRLPDSNVNEVASHGYVSFNVNLIPGLPKGTKIYNGAKIYFDQNAAIKTNITLNTIGEQYKSFLSVTDLASLENKVTFYPNPTRGSLNLSINGKVTNDITFEVFDLNGKRVQNILLPAANEHKLQLDLDPGMYLFHLTSDGKYLGTGRLMAY